MLREIPSAAAFTVTAAGVRFRAFAILARPLFSFAIVFIVLTSSFDHRTRLLFFLGMSTPIDGARLLGSIRFRSSYVFLQIKSAIHRRSFAVYIARYSFRWTEAGYRNRPIPQFNNSVFGKASCARLSFIDRLTIELVEINDCAPLCKDECQEHFHPFLKDSRRMRRR